MSRLSARALRRPMFASASVFLLVATAGCTHLTPDHGFSRVADLAGTRLQRRVVDPSALDDAGLQRRIAALLADPLTADGAVEIALVSNRRLRATCRDLGIAEADLVQASRLPNPGIEFKHTRGGNETVIERTFLADITALVTMPFALGIERSRFDEIRTTVGDAVLRTAADARRAWVDAVAADGRAALADDVVRASEAATDLAARMRAAGNWSAAAEAREQASAAEAVAAATRARQAALAKREALVRVLGLSSPKLTLPSRLPALPDEPLTIADAEDYAMRNRLDIEADRLANERLAASLGLTRATRFVDAFEVARDVDDRSGQAPERGYEIRIEVPLFDFGDARVAKSEALAAQALERSAARAIDAASEVRERYAGYRSTWDVAQRYRTTVVPQNDRRAADSLARYNGMLIGVFDLIADLRERRAVAIAADEALREFWIAEADLDEALGGTAADAAGSAR